MSKSASTPIVAAISTLPVIAACALFGATQASAVTCTADAAGCDPYHVTIEQVGANVVATGVGEFDLTGLTLRPGIGGLTEAGIAPSFPSVTLSTSPPSLARYTGLTGPADFGPGGETVTPNSSGPPVALTASLQLFVPFGYDSGTLLGPSQAIFDDATLASLGITPGLYEWTWGDAPDQSFTIGVAQAPGEIPLPAALPLFLGGLGMLVLAGRRRQLRRI
jgi:hypothetical protein